MRKTSLAAVRDTSKMLLHAVPLECNNPFGIVQHPFTNTMFSMSADRKLLDLSHTEDRDIWLKNTEYTITHSNVDFIFHYLNTPWLLTWLKFNKNNLSPKDFAKYLAIAWVSSENPNDDKNVPIRTLVSWFRNVDKRVLMQPDDYKYYQNLPDEVTLYRGVSPGRKKYGLSWTDDVKTAKWFKQRFEEDGNKGELLTATVPKEYCLCYFNTRGEKEIVLDVYKAKAKIKTM